MRDQQHPGALEQARRAVKAQVVLQALDLFERNGYEQTTVEEICAVAGISRSTFFRYFPAKQDLLIADIAGAGDELLQALRARPGGEAPWAALRHALGRLAGFYVSRPDHALRVARLVRATPALTTLHQEKLASWQALLTAEIAGRLGPDPGTEDLGSASDPRPRALIGAALSCFDSAVAAWAAGNGAQPLENLLRRAMDSISS
jgi:AcrR family transcriptional regulator